MANKSGICWLSYQRLNSSSFPSTGLVSASPMYLGIGAPPCSCDVHPVPLRGGTGGHCATIIFTINGLTASCRYSALLPAVPVAAIAGEIEDGEAGSDLAQKDDAGGHRIAAQWPAAVPW